jgi:hypothetical protein
VRRDSLLVQLRHGDILYDRSPVTQGQS